VKISREIFPKQPSLFITKPNQEDYNMKTTLTTLAIIALTASLSWGGTCSDGGCVDRSPQQPVEQSVTGSASQVEQPAPKGRARSMNLDDFAPDGRAVEKDCDRADCREPGTPQVEPRSQEKKCEGAGC